MPGETPGACEERLHIVSAHLRRLPRDRVRTRLADMCTGTTEQRGEAVRSEETRYRKQEKDGENVTMRDTHDTKRENTNKRKNRQ